MALTSHDILFMLVSWVNAVLIFLAGLLLPKTRNHNRNVKFHLILSRKNVDVNMEKDFVALFTGFGRLGELKQKSVSLFTLTDNEAHFVKVDSKLDVNDVKIGGFVFGNQFAHAKWLIKVPLDVFCAVAEDMDLPDCPITVISYTGRCGSTLLAQMLGNIDRIAVVSESNAFRYVAGRMPRRDKATDIRNQETRDPWLRACLVSTFKWVCTHAFITKRPGCIVVKNRRSYMNIVQPLFEIFPQIRHVTMYRGGLKSVQSSVRLFYAMPYTTTARDEKDMVRCLLEVYKDTLSPRFNLESCSSVMEIGCMLWVTAVCRHKQFVQAGIPIHTLRYEDLLEDPSAAIAAMLLYIGMNQSPKDVQRAVSAMEEDSQRGTLYSRSQLARFRDIPELEYTPDRRAACDLICDTLNVPRLDQDIYLPSTGAPK